MSQSGTMEAHLGAGSGLRLQCIANVLNDDIDFLATELDIGSDVAGGATTFDYGEGANNLITLINNRLPWPTTIVAHVLQGGVPAAGTLSLRIKGEDQFGQSIVELTPFATVAAVVNTYIYCSRVFSNVRSIEIAGTGLDDAQSIDINIGFLYTASGGTDTARNNLGVGTMLKMTRLQGTTLLTAFELETLQLHNIGTNAVASAINANVAIGQTVAGWDPEPNKLFFFTTPPQTIANPTKWCAVFRSLDGIHEAPQGANWPV